MDDEMLQKLEHVYDILNTFCELMDNEIIPKMQTMYMTPTYEDLTTAKGIVGQILDPDAQTHDCLMVSVPETRAALQKAYNDCQIMENMASLSSDEPTIWQLKSCFYSILNSTYNPEVSAQQRLENILSICEIGQNLIDDLYSDEFKKNIIPNNEREFYERAENLKQTFELLTPKMSDTE